MRDFKIGDIVKVKEWDEMKREFKSKEKTRIDCGDMFFVEEMEYLCGIIVTVTENNFDGINVDIDNDWTLTPNMVHFLNDCETVKDKKLNGIELQVRYIDKKLTRMEKIDKGDLIDLRASRIFSCNYNYESKDMDMKEVSFPYNYKQGETIFVKLGFALKVPEEYMSKVHPRSGTFKNYGLLLTNSEGQIDNSYQGNDDEWCGMFYATRDGVMEYNDRILQFEVVPRTMQGVKIDFVEDLGTVENRGGYSTTGVK